MKRLFSLLFGLFSAAVASTIIIIIGIFTNFDFQSFGIFFIIPIGSIITGLVGAAGYPLGLKFLNQKVKFFDYIVVALLGLVTAFILYFAFYQLIAINDQDEVIYSFSEGIHISDLTDESGKKYNFVSYMVESINERQISFSYNGKSLGKTISNPVVGWIDFIIELLGYIFGAIAILPTIISTKYCDNCKIYYKKKKWLEISLDKGAEIIEDLDKCIEKKGNIYDLIKTLQPSSGKVNIIFEGENCLKCHDGIFRTKFSILKKDNEREELDDLTQEIKLKDNMVIEGKFEGKKIIIDLKEITNKA